MILYELAAHLDPIVRLEILEKILELHEDRGAYFLISSRISPELEVNMLLDFDYSQGKIMDKGRMN